MAQSTTPAVARWRSGLARGIAALLVAVATFAPVSPVGAIDPATAVVSTGLNHSCAVDTDGTLWCWGSNYRAQLGIGSIDPVFGNGVDSPIQVGSDTDWRSVTAAGVTTCAIKTDDSLYCWGFNIYGAVGNGSTTTQTSPVLIGSGYQSVSGFSTHNCGIKVDGSLFCWGYNPYGGIGDGTSNNSRLSPVQVGSDTDWSQVSAGSNYTCALKSSGAIYCWGHNSFGQIGTLTGLGASGPGVHTPSQVGSDTDWTAVGAGLSTPCATKADGSLYCWGQNRKGELGGGVGDNNPHPTPTPFVDVPEPAPVEPDPVIEDEPVALSLPFFGVQSARAAGSVTWNDVRPSAHSCATTSDDRIYCWGDGAAGALGQGNTASSKAPLQVALGEPAAPSVVTDPSVNEVPELGVELTGLAGSWTGAPVPTFEFQWYRCTRSGSAVTATRVPSGCTKLSGATSRSYTPVRADVAKRLRLAVKATNTLGSVTRFSATSSIVVAAPFNSSAPTVSGTVRVGRSLSARAGSFSGTSPMSYGYQWFACTSKVRASATLDGSCVAIGGATGSRVTLTRAEGGKFIVVGVTATNAYGSATHYSNATTAVR